MNISRRTVKSSRRHQRIVEVNPNRAPSIFDTFEHRAVMEGYVGVIEGEVIEPHSLDAWLYQAQFREDGGVAA